MQEQREMNEKRVEYRLSPVAYVTEMFNAFTKGTSVAHCRDIVMRVSPSLFKELESVLPDLKGVGRPTKIGLRVYADKRLRGRDISLRRTLKRRTTTNG
jgi:hypothetical protein